MILTVGRTISTLLVTMLVVGLTNTVSQVPPVSQAAREDPTSLLNIRFQEDVRVFTVMAALNVAGFDYERSGMEMSHVRREVRDQLGSLDPVLLARLRNFFQDHLSEVPLSEQHIDYTSLALILTQPPDFDLNLPEQELPAGVWRVKGFEALLQEFFLKGQIATIWEGQRQYYKSELAGYLPVLRRAVKESLDYFRVPVRVMMDRHILLIPDLLNAHEIVNARNLERVYYIVVGPTRDPSNNFRQLQHEYLHSLVDPLIAQSAQMLQELEELLNVAQSQHRIRPALQNKFLLVVAESLIEALQIRLRKPEGEALDREIVRLFREGLIFTPLFHRQLIEYETNELLSLPTFSEIILKSIGPSIIRDDLQDVASLEQKHREQDVAKKVAFEKEQEEVRLHNVGVRTLREAGRMIGEKQFAAAEALLEELLLDDPTNGSAFFYLGQIASQTGRYEDSYEWYLRATGSSVEDWVKAWSFVRMGRIAASRGDFQEARGHFEASLALEGDLKGAREDARQLIEKLPKD